MRRSSRRQTSCAASLASAANDVSRARPWLSTVSPIGHPSTKVPPSRRKSARSVGPGLGARLHLGPVSRVAMESFPTEDRRRTAWLASGEGLMRRRPSRRQPLARRSFASCSSIREALPLCALRSSSLASPCVRTEAHRPPLRTRAYVRRSSRRQTRAPCRLRCSVSAAVTANDFRCFSAHHRSKLATSADYEQAPHRGRAAVSVVCHPC